MANQKKAKIKNSVNPQKQAKQAADPESYINKSPSWAFSNIDSQSWCIHDEFFNRITEKLQSYESMTWQEISSASKGGRHSVGSKSHSIPVENLCREAQKRLEELHIHEDWIYSLRLTGTERIFGILDRGVLRIIWYDPDHQICPANKY